MSYPYSVYDDEPPPLDPCPYNCGADQYTECDCDDEYESSLIDKAQAERAEK